MGKINLGILGGFSGKVGNVIGGKWKGIDYMRAKATSVSNPRTEGQLRQRVKFAAAINLLSPMTDFLRVGFKRYAHKQSAFNAAMSYNLKNAMVGDYNEYNVDLQKLLISRGNLRMADNAQLTAIEGTVTVSWEEPDIDSPLGYDVSMVLIYNPLKSQVVFETDGNVRGTGYHTMSVPTDWDGDSVEVFLSFIAADGKDLSNSLYVGTIQAVKKS